MLTQVSRPLRLGGAALLAALLAFGALAPAHALPDRPVLALYYPWYSPGQFTGVDQPALPYDSDDPAAVARQIAEAQRAGIDGFVSAWNGPGDRTDRNFARLLDLAAEQGFSATLYVETTSLQDPEAIVGGLRYALERYSGHPAFVRFAGRPVLFFWANRLLSVETWRAIREQVDPGSATVWIGEGDRFEYLAVFDGIHPYSIAWSAAPARQLASYSVRTRQWAERLGQPKLWLPTAMPGYDDRSTGRPDAFVRERAAGAYLEESFRGAVASQPDWAILLTSWNEWLEGTQIEPSVGYGTYYVDLLGALVSEWRGQHAASSVPAEP